jgi:N-acetylglucosamine repressor
MLYDNFVNSVNIQCSFLLLHLPMPSKKATHQQTKQRNRDLVLKHIFDHETISRAEVARITKLTRTTVSEIVASLLEEGLVKEIGFGSSIGGKAPILLSLLPDSRYLIGLNLAQDKFIGSIVNLRGEIKEKIECTVNKRDGEKALQLVYQILDQLLQKGWTPLMGIGIGTPGLVNTQEGVVINAVNLDWQDLPLAHLVESRYHLPVSILNDSQATAIGEYVYGEDHQSDTNLIVITVKHGIGSGILINGQLFQGDGGGAGEIGHIVVQENGALCRCGNYGCLETIASATAVVQRARILAGQYPNSGLAENPHALSLTSIEAGWKNNDPLAVRVVSDAARYLGISIAGLVGVLNIQKIILTGDMGGFGERWLQAIRDAMAQVALTRMARNTKLEIGKLDYRACILGASAYMLLDNYSLLFQTTTVGLDQ